MSLHCQLLRPAVNVLTRPPVRRHVRFSHHSRESGSPKKQGYNLSPRFPSKPALDLIGGGNDGVLDTLQTKWLRLCDVALINHFRGDTSIFEPDDPLGSFADIVFVGY